MNTEPRIYGVRTSDIIDELLLPDIEEDLNNLLEENIMTNNEITQKRAYTIDEVKTMYGVGRTSVYKLINEGTINVVHVGRRTLILATELPEFEKRLLKTTK